MQPGKFVTLMPRRATSFSSLFRLGYEDNVFRWRNTLYPNEDALLAVGGGVKSGNTRTFGPLDTGPVTVIDPSGFADSPGSEAAGEPSVSGSNTRLDMTGSNVNYRAYKAVATPTGKQYKLSGRAVSKSATGVASCSLALAGNNALGGGKTTNFNLAALPSDVSVSSVPVGATSYVGHAVQVTASVTSWIELTNRTLVEQIPYDGYVGGSLTGGLAFRIKLRTPASAPASTEVIQQWGGNDEQNRIRLVYDTSGHLRLIGTNVNVEQANIDLGAPGNSATVTVQATVGRNRVAVRVGTDPIQTDIAFNYPGAGQFWVGRGFTGEAFSGQILDLEVWGGERPLDGTFVLGGDSYGSGANELISGIPSALHTELLVYLNGFKIAAGGAEVVNGTTSAVSALTLNPGLGTNGIYICCDGDANSTGTLLEDMAGYATLAALARNYLFTNSTVRRGSSTATRATDRWAAMQAVYPSSRLYDLNGFLKTLASGSDDLQDVADGYAPRSVFFDTTHLFQSVMALVAADMYATRIAPLLAA